MDIHHDKHVAERRAQFQEQESRESNEQPDLGNVGMFEKTADANRRSATADLLMETLEKKNQTLDALNAQEKFSPELQEARDVLNERVADNTQMQEHLDDMLLQQSETLEASPEVNLEARDPVDPALETFKSMNVADRVQDLVEHQRKAEHDQRPDQITRGA